MLPKSILVKENRLFFILVLIVIIFCMIMLRHKIELIKRCVEVCGEYEARVEGECCYCGSEGKSIRPISWRC